MTLHDEIYAILDKNGNRWMTTSALADEVNERVQYRRRDGSSMRDKPMRSNQIAARVRKHPELFDRDDTRGVTHWCLTNRTRLNHEQ